jgi:NADH:ubiquinone oxidoreductase subunit 5 (subunit L)/multisubunit Na+/H+ antiporter MnhA subunit
MLGGVALTALYAARVTWLVFFAPSGDLSGLNHVHDAPVAMRLALAPLVVGALTTWLLVEWLSQLLDAHTMSLSTLIGEVMSASATYLTLGVLGLGVALWWQREQLTVFTWRLHWLKDSAVNGFGFEWVNRHIADWVVRGASALRATQTGQLNWNVVGIVGGLVIVLVMGLWSAR